MNTRSSAMGDTNGATSLQHRSRQLKKEETPRSSHSIITRSLKRRQSLDNSVTAVNEPKSSRGRPPKVKPSSARRVVETNGLPVVTIGNTFEETLPTNGNSAPNGNSVLTIDNPVDDKPPQLVQQFCADYHKIYDLTDEGISSTPSTSSQRSVATTVSKGQECSIYIQICKNLTQTIESEGLTQSNLMAALKYTLLKCFSGNIDMTVAAIKNDISIGASFDIDNQTVERVTTTRADTQTADNKFNWNGIPYTPQPKYE